MTNNQIWQFDKVLDQIGQRYKNEGLESYWNAEKAALEVALHAISTHLPPERYRPIQVLGVGGSGIVLRVTDERFPKIDNALKFPRPIEGKVNLVVEMLQKEISHLAELRHPGIVRIVYYNNLEPVEIYHCLPFYLMEFVDGAPSKEFVRNPNLEEKRFREIVSKAAKALAYLHKGDSHFRDRFAHLDVKAENILITADSTPIIIDLGTCKRLVSDEDLTVVACTRSNAHPQLMRLLVEDPSDDNRAKGEVHRSRIDPGWDLWAFGLTMLDWIGINRDDGSVEDNAIYRRLIPYTRKYYILLVARLLSYSLRSWIIDRVGLSQQFLQEFKLESADDLCDALARLEGESPLRAIDEPSTPSSGSFQAAPGQHVHLTPALVEVLEHPLFRRLDSITQLGVSSQVYPGVKHTRREHSLGTYANTGRILQALFDDSFSPFFRQVVTEEDCRALLLAALLHDIGQFPLAHDLEEIDKEFFGHSELTHAMLKGEWNRKKKGSRRIFFNSLANIFARWKTSDERVLLCRLSSYFWEALILSPMHFSQLYLW